MIGLFKQKSPGNIALLFIFGLLVKLPLFLHPKTTTAGVTDGPLYQAFLQYVIANNAFLASILAFALLYTQALQVSYLANEYRLLPRPNYLAGMAYLLITSLLPQWSYLSANLLANTFIIWMFIKLFSLYHQQPAGASIYNMGLLAGISSFIYFPSASFAVCVLIGILILKPFRLNEIVLFLLGCLTPYYFYAVYLYLVNRLTLPNVLPEVVLQVPVVKSSIWLAASTLLLTLPFLLGSFFIQKHMRKMLIQVRKNWSILLLYLLFACFVPFVNDNGSFSSWVLIAAPFSLFHACAYFYPLKKWLPLLLFFVTLCFVLFQQFATATWH